jgi:RNA polymerase sigma factor (TIGR02999 family)
MFDLTYEELRRLASSVRGHDPSDVLTPTALVSEAYLRLARSPRLAAASRQHFKRIAARAMREALVDAARRRKALKRGGAGVFVTLDDDLDAAPECSEEVLALNEALRELARRSPRQAHVVECRFFDGFDLAETAALLRVSESTVLRDWRLARKWLALELGRAE